MYLHAGLITYRVYRFSGCVTGCVELEVYYLTSSSIIIRVSRTLGFVLNNSPPLWLVVMRIWFFSLSAHELRLYASFSIESRTVTLFGCFAGCCSRAWAPSSLTCNTNCLISKTHLKVPLDRTSAQKRHLCLGLDGFILPGPAMGFSTSRVGGNRVRKYERRYSTTPS